MNPKTTGAFIAALRKEKNLTQKQLADKLNVSDKAISRWETGKGYPDIEFLMELSQEFSVSINELLSGKRNETPAMAQAAEKDIACALIQTSRKKRISSAIAIVCVAVVVLLGVIFLLNFFKNAPFRWSRSVCEAVRLEDTDKALRLIDEGVCKGYSMDTLSESPSFIWSFLEHAPRTPLQMVCEYGNYQVAEKLIANGASVRPQEGGSTREPIFCVLCRAYSQTDTALIQLLIDHGAVFSDHQLGDTVMIEAAFRTPYIPGTDADSSPGSRIYSAETAEGIADVFLLLSEYGNCYATNEAGQNPLHCAVVMENWELVGILLEKFDYSLDAQDIHGKTAYDLAVESGAEEEILSKLMPK